MHGFVALHDCTAFLPSRVALDFIYAGMALACTPSSY